jgi:poly(A) polymerase
MLLSKNIPQAMTTENLGSYQLGGHLKSADIDVLCIAPRNIERADYFTWFLKLLKKQPEVKDWWAVEKAFVPIIKMNFESKLIYCSHGWRWKKFPKISIRATTCC